MLKIIAALPVAVQQEQRLPLPSLNVKMLDIRQVISPLTFRVDKRLSISPYGNPAFPFAKLFANPLLFPPKVHIHDTQQCA